MRRNRPAVAPLETSRAGPRPAHLARKSPKRNRTVRVLAAVLLAAVAAGRADEETRREEAGQKPVDWSELFKIHWKNRVRSFEEQNRAWRNVVLLGDSITEGFDAEKYFPGRRVLNRGIGADVIGDEMPEGDPRGVLQRLDNSLFDCAATDVFLLIGVNDLNAGRSVDQMERGYRILLDRIRERAPGTRVHVQSLLPTSGKHAARNADIVEFNRRLRGLAEEFACGYLDLHELLADEDGELRSECTGDGLHLTEAGYRIWRKRIEEAMGWSGAK